MSPVKPRWGVAGRHNRQGLVILCYTTYGVDSVQNLLLNVTFVTITSIACVCQGIDSQVVGSGSFTKIAFGGKVQHIFEITLLHCNKSIAVACYLRNASCNTHLHGPSICVCVGVCVGPEEVTCRTTSVLYRVKKSVETVTAF